MFNLTHCQQYSKAAHLFLLLITEPKLLNLSLMKMTTVSRFCCQYDTGLHALTLQVVLILESEAL